MATTKKRTTKKSQTIPTTNEQIVLKIPGLVTETSEFEIVQETVTSGLLPTGFDTMYGLRNKLTGMIELRGHSLALSIVVLQNQQQMYDKVKSGEMNGYAFVDNKMPHTPGIDGIL